MRSSGSEVLLTGRSLTVGDLVAVARDCAFVALVEPQSERPGEFVGAGGREPATGDGSLRFLGGSAGEPLPAAVVRGAMLLQANALSNGYSGVRPVVVQRLLQLLNAGITPVTPRHAVVGAGAGAGAAPSAHVARVLLGLGDVHCRGVRIPSAVALRAAGIEPIAVRSKEGLALLGGATVMTSIAALVLDQAEYLVRLFMTLAVMRVELLAAGHDGRRFAVRPGTLATIAQARVVIERQMNTVGSDPPAAACEAPGMQSASPEDEDVARTLDGLKAELANLASQGHALMATLVDGQPDGSVEHLQRAQAGLVALCRQMCAPDPLNTLASEQYNQDTVLLGLHSALAAMEMTVPVRTSLSILSLALCRAAERGAASGASRLSRATERFYRDVSGLSSLQDGPAAWSAVIGALDAALAMRAMELSFDA